MTRKVLLVREHGAGKRQLGTKRDWDGGMTRYLAAVTVLALAALALPAAGGSETENSFCDIETSAVCAAVAVQKIAENPCMPPDTVFLSGTIHVAVFQDENQGRIHTNWQDVSGVGLTGTIYQANEATRVYEVARPSGSFTFVLQDERTLVSKGRSEFQNFILREYFEITVDPRKDPPLTIKEHGETRCTG
jgi:hypothetical protein